MKEYTCYCCSSIFVTKYKPSNMDKPYCSRTCASKVNNKTFPKRILTKKCIYCNSLCSTSKQFCTAFCYSKYRAENKKPSSIVKNEAIKKYKKSVKQQAIEYLGGCCSICGYKKCNRALHFHHIDSTSKKYTISSVTKKFEVLKEELDKCILLCSNCHAEVHDGLVVPEGIEPSSSD